MKKTLKILVIITFIISFAFPINSNAKANVSIENIVVKRFEPETTTDSNTKSNSESEISDCQGILGDVNDEDSVAWLLQTLLNYIKILGPMLAIALGSVDFARAVVASDDDAMKKTQKRFINRLIAAVLLFFIPLLTSVVLQTFGFTVDSTTCGIK